MCDALATAVSLKLHSFMNFYMMSLPTGVKTIAVVMNSKQEIMRQILGGRESKGKKLKWK
ncbi:CLUMA_CG005988, isoform A [Clunio marinus]|uniref:CLUMA_CG005988, isoform A n=1 Tax=Clunio marinus TaxID=568069 RepID=A0A1J1HXW2_9DIPT|nr:CLUMA_CG005988, isoform A [Clunio marinus]